MADPDSRNSSTEVTSVAVRYDFDKLSEIDWDTVERDENGIPQITIEVEIVEEPIGMNPAVGGTVSGVRQAIDILSDGKTAKGSLITNVVISAVDVLDAALNGSLYEVGKQISGLVGGILGAGVVAGAAGYAISGAAALLGTTMLTPFGVGVFAGLVAIQGIIAIGAAVYGAIKGEEWFEKAYDAGMSSIIGVTVEAKTTAQLKDELEIERFEISELISIEQASPEDLTPEDIVRLDQYKFELSQQSGGPTGMGNDPRDPRGQWQIPGAPGDTTGSGAAASGHVLNSAPTGGSGEGKSQQTSGSTSSGPTNASSGGTTTNTPSTGSTGGNKPSQVSGGGSSQPSSRPSSTVDHTATEDRRPILLDLDGNGVKITEFDKSSAFVAGKDGLQHRTSWAGAGDGVLFFDPDGRNAITEARQYVFTEWDPTASGDLEAVRSTFDTNGDGKLTSADAEFAKFKVMVTHADEMRWAA